ncbi:YgaP-like transmembrane domain [Pelotomaculum propionicicum]|uniref:Inner membrane protein YgaP-like transmembrane domain-containing protein n=1 Tax=Pelotomaculum propionicicum TaxID=258475 RepID=A0A4Y7RTW3_9FIRM|nr:hypothetical protein Pmgp_01483 [Pelotomaculum propionicicum]
MVLDLRRNLSNADRAIRTVTGLLLLYMVYVRLITGIWATTAAIVFALFLLIEAASAY